MWSQQPPVVPKTVFEQGTGSLRFHSVSVALKTMEYLWWLMTEVINASKISCGKQAVLNDDSHWAFDTNKIAFYCQDHLPQYLLLFIWPTRMDLHTMEPKFLICLCDLWDSWQLMVLSDVPHRCSASFVRPGVVLCSIHLSAQGPCPTSTCHTERQISPVDFLTYWVNTALSLEAELCLWTPTGSGEEAFGLQNKLDWVTDSGFCSFLSISVTVPLPPRGSVTDHMQWC